MLNIRDLHVSIDGKQILRGLDLDVPIGEVHAIMGPNGSGKSTLAQVLVGRDGYEVTRGSARYLDRNLFELSPEARAHGGLFLAFQYPLEVPGVSNVQFLRAALNSLCRSRGTPEMDAFDFLEFVKSKLALLEMDDSFLYRSLNEGFSGGEKKRNEILQMAVLEPRLAILDEPDSGLDIDALRVVARGVNTLRNPDRSLLLVTHYPRLLEYIVPDRVHVLINGRIVMSGDHQLADELEQRGYGWISDEVVTEEVRP
jgi:Fe-S cluster assembly ATP-binding protein